MRKATVLLVLFAAGSAFADHECGHTAVLSCPAQGIAAALASADCAASDGSRFDVWEFAGAEGETVTVTLSSSAFDTMLILLDPADIPVAENDDAAAGGTDSRITFTLTVSGTWTIIANSLAPAGSGDYYLSLSCPAQGPRRRAVRH